MSDFEYQIPETYEEAVERKAYVLKLINEYNEALLLGKELPCSEEEIDRLQEEYQILNAVFVCSCRGRFLLQLQVHQLVFSQRIQPPEQGRYS